MTQAAKRMGPGWERQQVSFWITPQRRQDLLALAQGLPTGATPSDVIATAIAVARSQMHASSSSTADLADAIDVAISSAMTDTRSAVRTQSHAIDEMSKGLRSIHALLAALAGEEGLHETNGIGSLAGYGHPAAPQAFKQWLEASLALAGGRPQRSAVAKASWQGVSRVSDRLVAVDFSASLAAIDGKPIASALAASSTTVRFDLLEASHPFATVQWAAQLYFVCQPVGNGWVIHAHRAGPDGTAGAAIGQAKA
jgi:hypothetical protein